MRWRAARRAGLLLIVLIGWVLFRAESIGDALRYYQAMFVPTGGTTAAVEAAMTSQALVILGLASLIVFLPGTRSGGRFLIDGRGWPVVSARTAVMVVLLPLALVMAFAGDYSPFLYFQF